jgi:predicted short-subunit dehydrogenase-like oxidoreductase (DUF2520 family)
MRELERDLPAPENATLDAPAAPGNLVVIGPGRAGRSVATAATAAGIEVRVLGRGEDLPTLDPTSTMVLLCVPDGAIEAACEHIAAGLEPGIAVGHSSGATPLGALAAAAARGRPTFSLHPLQTIPAPDTSLADAPCAVAGSDPAVLARAHSLAAALGMRPFDVPEEHRAAYHAAASMASNFLIALEESAAELLGAAGVEHPREVLAPIVLRTAANWADAGSDALTGPIARGDEHIVSAHLEALEERMPELAPLYQALAECTRAIARRERTRDERA